MRKRGTLRLLIWAYCAGVLGSSVQIFSNIERGIVNHVYAASAESAVEIERVDFKGVRLFSSGELENILEIGPGDSLERLKVVRTEENLQQLYVDRGYEQVKIRSRLVRKRGENKKLETTLEISVEEGLPVRIASISVVPFGKVDSRNEKLWDKRIKEVRTNLGLDIGDIYNSHKLNENRRTLQEILASAEYIGSRVDILRSRSSFPEILEKKGLKSSDAAEWLSIEVKLDMGERVDFGYRGNTVFTRGYLDSLVDDQRLLGLGKDYVGVIKSKIEDEYRSAGYARVEIIPYTYEAPATSGPGFYQRKVTYQIQEGPRVKIDTVDFDGNAVFSSQDLRNQFFSKASSLVQHGFFVEKDVQKAAELLIEGMREKGYLSAHLVATNVFYPPKPRTQQQNSSVRLLIYVYEGDQTVIQNIAIQGASVLSTEEIAKLLKVEKNQPLNLFALSDGIENLKRIYREKGYLSFKILNEEAQSLVQYQSENRLADVTLELSEGTQFRVGRIELEGLVRTHEEVVRRELRIKEGEIIQESHLSQSERQLRKLGIFSNVTFKAIDDPENPQFKIIRITLVEADRGILAGGPGFRNDLGVRLFGQLSYTNLWGKNHTVSLSATANRRFYNYNFGEGQAQVAYVWPWFGIPELNFRPSISVGRTQYSNFFADNLTVSANWDKQLSSYPLVMGYFSYTLEKIFQNGASAAIDNDAFQIGTITPKVSIDLRDSPLAPTTGYFGMVWLDLAYSYFGTQTQPPIGYYRLQTRNDYYLPIFKGIIWYFSFRAGYEQSKNSNDDPNASQYYAIPLIKQFALGGIGSIRGYQEQEFHNQYSLVGGSLSYVNYRTQVDLPFTGNLKFGVFLDAGNLLVNNFSLGGLNYGTGFGFHYQTPVGPVNFDWGFKLNPRPGTDAYVIHFSVGII